MLSITFRQKKKNHWGKKLSQKCPNTNNNNWRGGIQGVGYNIGKCSKEKKKKKKKRNNGKMERQENPPAKQERTDGAGDKVKPILGKNVFHIQHII